MDQVTHWNHATKNEPFIILDELIDAFENQSLSICSNTKKAEELGYCNIVDGGDDLSCLLPVIRKRRFLNSGRASGTDFPRTTAGNGPVPASSLCSRRGSCRGREQVDAGAVGDLTVWIP